MKKSFQAQNQLGALTLLTCWLRMEGQNAVTRPAARARKNPSPEITASLRGVTNILHWLQIMTTMLLLQS